MKRRWPPGLHKIGGRPKDLRGRHYVYDLVRDTNLDKQPDLRLVLTSYVAGVGKKGDEVLVRPQFGYNHLLLPGYAVYSAAGIAPLTKATQTTSDEYSSPHVQRTMNKLGSMLLNVVMNKDVPWTLEKWHLRVAFRKAGYHMPDEAITLPEQPVSGPDLSLQGKHFYVTVKINQQEQVRVKCCIHHWSTKIVDRLPYVFEFWKEPTEPLFPNDEIV